MPKRWLNEVGAVFSVFVIFKMAKLIVIRTALTKAIARLFPASHHLCRKKAKLALQKHSFHCLGPDHQLTWVTLARDSTLFFFASLAVSVPPGISFSGSLIGTAKSLCKSDKANVDGTCEGSSHFPATISSWLSGLRMLLRASNLSQSMMSSQFLSATNASSENMQQHSRRKGSLPHQAAVNSLALSLSSISAKASISS